MLAFFFFFKQKTAYEMRISDWSSDVCSSDLIVGGDHYFNFGTDCLPQYLIGTGDVDGPLDVMPGLKRQVIPDHQELASAVAQHGHENGFDWTVEIGRAACREGVCQYV